jgi:hypothetical protein
MKGLGPISIALIAATALLLVEGLALNVFIGKEVSLKAYAKEMEVIKAVNLVQSIKRGLPYGLYYSYLEALKRGGYTSFSEVTSEEDFRANISSIFNEYTTKIEERSGVIIPQGSIELSSSDDEVTITFLSPNFLTYTYKSEELTFRISENSNTTIRIIKGQLVEQ